MTATVLPADGMIAVLSDAPPGISVVQMIQALRGCVHEMNKSNCSELALKAQHAIVVLDELRRALVVHGGDDDVYECWPLVRTEFESEAEIEHERDLREWQEQQAREQKEKAA